MTDRTPSEPDEVAFESVLDKVPPGIGAPGGLAPRQGPLLRVAMLTCREGVSGRQEWWCGVNCALRGI